MATLGSFLRPAKGRKPPLRAKWDHCFESLLDGTLDVSRQPRRWWDDFLLLGVNARLLSDTILATPEDRLFAQRGVFSAVCATCLSYLDDENLLRVSHALEILILINQSVSKVQWTRGASLGVINVCAGGQASADAHFDRLIDGCANLAADHTLPVALRRLALRLLLVVCASAPNVNQNALVGWFMVRDVYEPIMKILIAPVDVPGGGSDSATGAAATALTRGPEGFGNDEPRVETTTIDAFLSLGGASAESNDATGTPDASASASASASVSPSRDPRAARPRLTGAALGTTAERERLREEAAHLLALLLSWRESSNAYARRLEAADGVEISVLLVAACALVSTPAGTLGVGPGAVGGAVGGAVLGGFGFFGGALPPPPDNLLDSLMGWLGYEPEGNVSAADDAATRARALTAAVRPWELGAGPCAGLLLLHALMAHSRLPRMPAAWLDISPRPEETLRGVPLGSRWRETLGRTLCFTQRLCLVAGRDANPAATGPGPTRANESSPPTSSPRPRDEPPRSWSEWLTEYFRAADHPAASYSSSSSTRSLGKTKTLSGRGWIGTGSVGVGRWTSADEDHPDGPAARARFAASQALLAVSLLRALVDDQSASDFLHAADVSRLAPDGAVLGTDAAATRASASRPAAAAVLELVASVLIRGAPGEAGEASSSSTTALATESHAVYVAHRLLQTQAARGGRPLVFRWERLWEGLVCALRRCAANEDAAGLPHVAALASQAMNLASFCLTRRGELCSRPDDILPLVEAFVTEEATFAKIAAGAAKHGYLVDADDRHHHHHRAGTGKMVAGDPRSRRAGVRVANVAHVQARLRGAPPGKLREAARQALATLNPPVRDRLEAGWALAATPTTDARGGGSRGRERGTTSAAGTGVAPTAATDRVVANAARALVGELLRGVVGNPPEGLRPAVPR
jgi:hypothetical protein